MHDRRCRKAIKTVVSHLKSLMAKRLPRMFAPQHGFSLSDKTCMIPVN